MHRVSLRRARGLTGTAAIILALVAGCSKDDPVRPRESSQQLGTLVAAAGVVEPGSTLLGSAATDELVCTGASDLVQLAPLIAIRRTTGAVRTLDAVVSIPVAIAPDGSAAYYNAILFELKYPSTR